MSVWFITGSSRGFGRELASTAAHAGHHVVATARSAAALSDLVAEFPETVFAAALDVTDPAAADAALRAGLDRFGSLDVVVNNAGYANVAPIETGSVEDFRRQFETNFWGVYNVSRAAIPHLRAQGGGTIVQFSSIGGRVGMSPGIASYQAAKFAVDGFSRSLSVETAPFGIRVMVVEPSGFRTDWAGSSMGVADVPAGYDQTVGSMTKRMRESADGPAGDPARAAGIIVRAVERDRIPLHLLVGEHAVDDALAYSKRQIAEASTWEPVSRSADYSVPFPVDLPDENGTW